MNKDKIQFTSNTINQYNATKREKNPENPRGSYTFKLHIKNQKLKLFKNREFF